jgi:hypothetical protein
MSAKMGSFVVLASGSRTAGTTTSPDVPVEAFDEVNVYTDVTALTGSLVVTAQMSPDGGTTWFDHTAGGSISATGRQVLKLTNAGKLMRVSCVITTGPITFSVTIEGKRNG